MRKYFGTDGIRGVANEELTCELAYKLGRAAGYVLNKCNNKFKVLIGKDTRISSDMLESALASGIMSVGGDVVSLGVIPTPGVSYLTKKYNADFGIVISASHNPYEYNGIKFFNNKGFKLTDEIELEIEKYIDNQDLIDCEFDAKRIGKSIIEENATRDYASYLEEIVGTSFKGLNIVLDCANGAAYKIAPKVFEELGANVTVINNEPNGININVECGSTHTKTLRETVKKLNADLGLAYDGDADRLIAVDENGEEVNGDYILLICANLLKKENKLRDDSLVVTVMSNLGLHIAAKELGINIHQTKVGDRYVLEKMKEEHYSLGGEQSGHMIFLDYNTTGDGVLSSLFLVDAIVKENKKLSELKNIMTEYPQVLINAKVKNEHKTTYMNDLEIKTKIEDIEKELDGRGRVLIRPSGTEPLVRVMLEGEDTNHIDSLARNLATIIENKLS